MNGDDNGNDDNWTRVIPVIPVTITDARGVAVEGAEFIQLTTAALIDAGASTMASMAAAHNLPGSQATVVWSTRSNGVSDEAAGQIRSLEGQVADLRSALVDLANHIGAHPAGLGARAIVDLTKTYIEGLHEEIARLDDEIARLNDVIKTLEW